MTTTKSSIIDRINKEANLQRSQATRAVDVLFEIFKKSLENGEDVLISGFGKFTVKQKQDRKGRNPHTGDGMIIGPRRVVTFRCSPVLRERINQGNEKYARSSKC